MNKIVNLLPNSVISGCTALYFRGRLPLMARFCFNIFLIYSFTASALRQNGFRGTHSSQKTINIDTMKIRILPALSDNYMYLVSCPTTECQRSYFNLKFDIDHR